MDLLNYIILTTVIVVSPGPDSLLIINHTLTRGRASGFAVLTGVQVGVATHGVLSVVGISALLYHSQTLFGVLVIIGPLYLVWLGLQAIFKSNFLMQTDGQPAQQTSAPAAATVDDDTAANKTIAAHPLLVATRKGMLCNLLNPKVLILFVVLMPAYVQADAGLPPQIQLVIFATILLAINIPVQIILVLLAEQVRRWLQNPRILRWVQSVLGGILILMAAQIFIDHSLARFG